jgi:hypothetical protein
MRSHQISDIVMKSVDAVLTRLCRVWRIQEFAGARIDCGVFRGYYLPDSATSGLTWKPDILVVGFSMVHMVHKDRDLKLKPSLVSSFCSTWKQVSWRIAAFDSNPSLRRRTIMSGSILLAVWRCVISVACLLSVFTSVNRAETIYHCNNVTERESADFEGIEVDRYCKEFVAPPASKVDELRESCLDPSTGTGEWAEGACDKNWIAACSVKSIGPAPLEIPFTHYTYQPTGGNMTKKQVVEMARQQCQIMSLKSGKFTEQ